jgi:hypothetical protein
MTGHGESDDEPLRELVPQLLRASLLLALSSSRRKHFGRCPAGWAARGRRQWRASRVAR